MASQLDDRLDGLDGDDRIDGGNNAGLNAAGNPNADRVFYRSKMADNSICAWQKASFSFSGAVEAGDVLSAILRASGDGLGTQADDHAALQTLLAPAALQPLAASTRFGGRRVQLQRGYRQSDALDLAPLATAVRT